MSKLNTLSIEYIKGISSKTFQLDLFPNKPSVFVAPNGFGKSSIACGFKSLNNSRINLDERNHHNGNLANLPTIKITFDGAEYTATNSSNSISSLFDNYVINNSVIPKAVSRNMGKFSVATASLEISSVTLIDTIPEKCDFEYSTSSAKTEFGVNGKILPNATSLLTDLEYLYLFEKEIAPSAFTKVRSYKEPINAVIQEANQQAGTAAQIKQWIGTNLMSKLAGITDLEKLAKLIQRTHENDPVDSYLLAIQFAELTQTSTFKGALSYKLYLRDKAFFDQMLTSFNTSRHLIKTKESGKPSKKSLVVDFPKADEVSNGQRDILTFIAHIQRARRKFKKANCILIVDEIFDYLDDANLVAFQYYITQIIEEFKAQDRNIYPILLTHLDPGYFRHFCFSKHRLQIRYLDRNPTIGTSPALNLVKQRENPAIAAVVSKHHFHYHPQEANVESEFLGLGLRKAWGSSHKFYEYLHEEIAKYFRDETHDSIAVLLAIRTRIEKLAFEKLTSAQQHNDFHNVHGTGNKLDYCATQGIDIPETHYLLGIIYNDDLHHKGERDIETPLRSKLRNVTIKKIISELFT